MLKKLLSVLLTLCMLLSLVPTVFAAEATLYVDAASTAETPDGTKANPYQTIGAAIEAAAPGDTIFVKNGTYQENIAIGADKALTLEGESRDGVMILFDVATKNTTATYNTFPVYPIVYSESNLTLKDLTVSGPTNQHHGISGVLAKADLTMQNVVVKDIRCTADGGFVCGVTTYGHGIMIEGAGNATITGCTVKDFQKNAIDINTTGEVVLEGNIIAGVGPQTIIAQNGIVGRDGKLTLTDNTVSDLSYTADNEWAYASMGIYASSEVDGLVVTGNTLDAVDWAIDTSEVPEEVLASATIENNQEVNRVLNVQIGDNWYPSIEAAVKAAENNAIIKIYPGNYNIQQDTVTEVSGQAGWYLPIDKSVTLMGVDESGNEITDPTQTKANLYSTDYSANEGWATQNLITVFADNVTLTGLTIMNKIDANKSIEVVDGVENFVIRNCRFAPIAEELLEGIEPADLGGYSYEEYQDYGASLYFKDVTATVENNYFDRSNLTLDSTANANITITDNVFEGVKCWNNDPNYTYSAIGYTSWANPPVTDISDATLTIQENQFLDAGKINFSNVTEGQVDVSANYWEDMDLTEAIMGGENNAVAISTVYADKEMTTLIDVAVGEETLQEKIDAAVEGEIIDLEGKYWPGNLVITKPITLKNGTVDTITANGEIDGLTFETLTFLGASTEKNLDVNPSALYIYGIPLVQNVVVDGCTFQGPASDDVTVAITTGNVQNLTVKNSTIDGYTISAYHNPGQGGNIAYEDNTIKNVTSGIAFIATDGITVTGNTFENANGIRLEDNWGGGNLCTEVTIEENKFLSVPDYAIRTVDSNGVSGYEGQLTLDHNYWGSPNPDFEQLILTGADQNIEIEEEPYYINEEMIRLNTYPDDIIIGGGTTATTYPIRVNAAENGKIASSRTTASRNTIITLTVTPNEGYLLDTLTVTDQAGNTVALTDKGNGTYTFSMPASTVTVTATFVEEGVQPPAFPFTDVAADAWYYDAVVYAYENGLMNGIDETTFGPDITTTRSMIVAMLYRMEGAPEVTEAASFADVEGDSYCANAIAWASANNLVVGYENGLFGVNDTITREQMAAILYRYASFKGYDVTATANLSGYTDSDSISDYAIPAMQWANAKGLITGTSATILDPTGSATRAQVARVFMQFCETVAVADAN